MYVLYIVGVLNRYKVIQMYVLYIVWVLNRYKVIWMYVLYIVRCVESVRGDIDLCIVYCWGC